MITVASHEGRTILGRLDKGVDLLEGLLEVCRQRQVRTGVVSALGALQSVEVTHYDPQKKKYRPGRTLAGPLEILSAVGNLSERDGDLALHLHITVSREGDNGIEVLGGHLLSGVVFACEFSILACDDVMLRRSHDRATGLPLWKEGFEREDGPASDVPAVEAAPDKTAAPAEPAPSVDPAEPPAPAPAAPSTAGEPSWADVAAASQRAQVEQPAEPAKPLRPPPPEPPPDEDDDEGVEDELDYLDIEPGDIVEHPRFKRCTVARVEGDMEFVQVRLRNGNLVRLSLDIVRLVLVGSEDGHQVFKAIIDT